MPVLRAQREEAQSRRVARRIRVTSLLTLGFALTVFAFLASFGLIDTYVASVSDPVSLSVIAGASLLAAVAAVARIAGRAGRRVAGRLAAEPLQATDRRRQRLLHRVEEMALAAGIPAPRVWLRPGAAPNVSAWSDRDGDHLAFTEGALDLPQPELAVLAAHGCARLRLHAGRTAAGVDDTAAPLLRWFEEEWYGHRDSSTWRWMTVLFFIMFSLHALLLLWAAKVVARQLRVARRDRAQAADAIAANLTRDPDSFRSLMKRMDDAAVEGGGEPELVAATSFAPPPGTLDAASEQATYRARFEDARRGWSIA